VLAAALGCQGGADDGAASRTDGGTEGTSVGDDASGPSSASASGDDAETGGTTGDDADSTADEGTETGDEDEVAAVCERWLSDRADMSEGQWSGSVDACDPGDISADGRANALRIMNLYRWLADLPPVETSAERNARAQACAFLMHANGQLSHNPPTNWACYSADGSQGAGNSNISPTPGVAAVDLYMADPGNPDTLGHRRWILSSSIGPTGLGSTSQYSCMWTLGGSGDADAAWTAYPPPGVVPYEAMTASWTPVDATGWSLQSDTIALAGAQVEVTRDGETLPMAVHQLIGGYGSAHAISMTPQGWQTTSGSTYHVSVTGIAQPIEYDVHVVSCSR
jgi:uncharacterized protein YkwD